MHNALYEKLKNNPHYKMSAKQKEEAQEFEREPMIEFGEAEYHDQAIPMHDIQRRAARRRNRKMLE